MLASYGNDESVEKDEEDMKRKEEEEERERSQTGRGAHEKPKGEAMPTTDQKLTFYTRK